MYGITTILRTLTIERLLVLILFSTALISIKGYDADVFLHLATGKQIVANGELPHRDIFSFTRSGERWVMHEWLYQTLLFAIYSTLGSVGLKVLGAGLLTLTLYINKKNCELAGATSIISWGVTLITFLTWVHFISVRPHMVTFAFFVLTIHFLFLYRYRAKKTSLYIIPLMMVLWVNIHGAFIVGIVLTAYFAALSFSAWHLGAKRQSNPRPLLNIVALTILVTLFNPYGFEQLMFPFQLMNQWVMRYVTEWQPPDITQWNNMLYLTIVAAYLLVMRKAPNYERWFHILLAAPFILASFDAIRHIPLASFLIAPFLASRISHHFGEYLANRRTSTAPPIQNHPGNVTAYMGRELGEREYLANWVVLSLFYIILYLIYPTLQQHSEKVFAEIYPVGATHYLISNDIRGRMFSSMEYSDYILFSRFPAQKVFYDVRLEIYGEKLSRDYMTMINAQSGWQKLFRQYSIEYIVIEKTKPIYAALMTSDDYALLYEDDFSAIFSLRSP